MGDNHQSEYKIGDLVKCIYDLFDYYEYFWDDEPNHGYPFHGIVIDIQNDILEDEFGYEKLYIVKKKMVDVL